MGVDLVYLRHESGLMVGQGLDQGPGLARELAQGPELLSSGQGLDRDVEGSSTHPLVANDTCPSLNSDAVESVVGDNGGSVSPHPNDTMVQYWGESSSSSTQHGEEQSQLSESQSQPQPPQPLQTQPPQSQLQSQLQPQPPQQQSLHCRQDAVTPTPYVPPPPIIGLALALERSHGTDQKSSNTLATKSSSSSSSSTAVSSSSSSSSSSKTSKKRKNCTTATEDPYNKPYPGSTAVDGGDMSTISSYLNNLNNTPEGETVDEPAVRSHVNALNADWTVSVASYSLYDEVSQRFHTHRRMTKELEKKKQQEAERILALEREAAQAAARALRGDDGGCDSGPHPHPNKKGKRGKKESTSGGDHHRGDGYHGGGGRGYTDYDNDNDVNDEMDDDDDTANEWRRQPRRSARARYSREDMLALQGLGKNITIVSYARTLNATTVSYSFNTITPNGTYVSSLTALTLLYYFSSVRY